MENKTVVVVWRLDKDVDPDKLQAVFAKIASVVKENLDCGKTNVFEFTPDDVDSELAKIIAIKEKRCLTKSEEVKKAILYGDELIKFLSEKFELNSYRNNPDKSNLFFMITGALAYALSKTKNLQNTDSEEDKLISAIKTLATNPIYHTGVANRYGYTSEVECIVKKIYKNYFSEEHDYSKEDGINSDVGIHVTVK